MPLCASKGVQDTSKPYQGSGDDICETCVDTSGCTICRVSGTCVADDGIAICPMINDPPDDHRGQNIHRKAKIDVCYSNIIDNWMVNLYMVEAAFSSGSCSLTKRAQFMLKATDGTWKSVPNPFKPLQQSDSISAWNDLFELKLVAPADTEAIDLCIAPGWVGIRVDVGLSVPRIGILNSTSLNNPDSLSTCSFPGIMHAFRFAVPASPQVLALTGNETVDLTRANIKVSARDTSYNEKEHSIHLLQGGVDHSLGMICPSVSPSPNPAISGSDSSNNAGPGPSGSGPGNMGPGSSGSGSGIVGLGPSGSTIGASSPSGSDSTIGDDGGGLNGGIIVGAVAGGLVAILTAGIPILFLQTEETATVADKLAGLESGVGALEDIEEISSDDSPPTAPKSGSI